MSDFDPIVSPLPETPEDDPRRLRGLEIAAMLQIKRVGSAWSVPSQTTAGIRYTVCGDECDCPDYERRQMRCKHAWAVEFFVRRETVEDGIVTTKTAGVRVTYGQSWHAYDQAQLNEFDRFLPLLRELCDGIEQPEQTMGRPRLPLSDVVFALGVKTYSMVSGRRSMSLIRDTAARGLLDTMPSYATAFRCLESPALTDILKTLIEESAQPLAAIETDFAIDSTGIGTTTYRRWFDHKWGKERSTQTWVKLHAMSGTTTNVITAVEATATESNDSPQLPALLNRTAARFDVREVSADRAYSSVANLHAIQHVGAAPFIPFKKNSKPGGSHHGNRYDALWSKMWFYYQFRRADFSAHYHKRSNAETTFHMLKAKFGGNVRAKTPTAQINEALLKVLAHNIVVLVQSIYELGIEPEFWTQTSTRVIEATAPRLL